MRLLALLLCGASFSLLLAGCDASTKPGRSADAATTSSAANLVARPPARPAFEFRRQELEGIGTIELPAGPGWQREDRELFNEQLGLTIVIQSEPEGVAGAEKDYLDSYNELNVRDAPAWQRGPETLGNVHGVPAARTEGSFNNGTAMTTRDYIFFAPDKTVLLQTRAPAVNAAALIQLTDYVAATFQKQP